MADRRDAGFPVGVDYHPLDAERQSYAEWYARDPEEDFRALASARISMARVFVSWKCLEPQVGQYDEEAFGRFDRLVAAARAANLRLMVTLFADDRVSELTDVPWGRKRDPRTDPYLMGREVALVQRVVNRYRGERAVLGWVLADEAFLSGFGSAEDLAYWTRTMRAAIRDVDSERPISFSADPETFYRAAGIDPRSALDSCEFRFSHATAGYQSYITGGALVAGPATYLDSFLLRLARTDLPVTVDGIGVWALDHSPGEEAVRVRRALWSAFANRGAGAVLRRFRDIGTERRDPYFLDPWESVVGVADADGFPKPAMREAEAFVEAVGRIDLRRYSFAPERLGVVMPAERYETLPSLAGLYAPRACLQAYVSAKETHVPVEVVREGDDLAGFLALVVPSPMGLRTETWDRLREFVGSGGSLVLSYGGGDPDPRMRELFGVEFLGDGGPRETLSCRVAQPGMLGDLKPFDAKVAVPAYALLGQAGAVVVATDATSNPLLTVQQFGQGRAVLLASPVERSLAQGDPLAAPHPVRRLLREAYGAVALAAGATVPFDCDRPEVETALLTGEGEDVMLLLNHAAEKVTATIRMDRAVKAVADVRAAEPTPVSSEGFAVSLPLGGAAALRVLYP